MKTNTLKQPKALTILFLTEMWERFSFYGMRSLLVLYIVQHMHWSEGSAFGVLGAYASLVYLGGVVGGFVADQLLGFRRAIILGGITITCGHFMLAFEHTYALFLGLGLVVCGTALFKSNITSFLGDFYEDQDPRREAGFSIFYFGINLGSLIAFLACGYVAKRVGWHAAFSLAGIGMLFGLIIFLSGKKHLEGKGEPRCRERLMGRTFGLPRTWLVYLGIVLTTLVVAWLIFNNEVLGNFLIVAGIVVLGYSLFIAFKSSKTVRANIFSLLVMMSFVLLFLAFWEQQGNSLTFFIDKFVDRTVGWLQVLGINEVPTSSFGFLNATCVILFAVPLGFLWVWLARRHKAPYAPMKFVLSLVLLSIAFLVVAFAGDILPVGEQMNMGWIVLFYAIYTLGELCILPVGYSMVTKLAPEDHRGFFMGAWFMSLAFAEYVAAILAKLTTADDAIGQTASISVYTNFFESLAYWGFGAAAVLLVLSFFMRNVFSKVEAH